MCLCVLHRTFARLNGFAIQYHKFASFSFYLSVAVGHFREYKHIHWDVEYPLLTLTDNHTCDNAIIHCVYVYMINMYANRMKINLKHKKPNKKE